MPLSPSSHNLNSQRANSSDGATSSRIGRFESSYAGRFASSYVGRFAPSPTGPLHFGSLLAALASFLDARAHGGRWLVRIEDIDPPREVPGAAQAILECLTAHGLIWDDDVIYQSQHLAIYRAACTQLIEQRRAFYCTCSRLDLSGNNGIYQGDCRECYTKPRQNSKKQPAFAIRLRADAIDIRVDDRIQPAFTENLARDIGDFVIYRKEDLPAYQLAVVIDDAAQGITHVVRGSDLLSSTARQIFLQHCLQLPTPCYAHIPVIANAQHQKLSKQTLAQALDSSAAKENLLAALEFLRQPLPPADAAKTVQTILQWATMRWNLAPIPRQPEIAGSSLPSRCRHFAR